MEKENRETSYFGPIFINRNCIELPVSLTGEKLSEDEVPCPDKESQSCQSIAHKTAQPPKQQHSLSPKKFLQQVGRGMALIRNDKLENRLRHIENTYISYNENGNEIEYTSKRNSNSTRNESTVELTGRDETNIETADTGYPSNIYNEQQDTVIEVADKTCRNHCHLTESTSDPLIEQSDRNKATDKPYVLHIPNLAFKKKSELKENTFQRISKGNENDKENDNSDEEFHDLEVVKDKVFGKKRILTELKCNAYGVKCNAATEQCRIKEDLSNMLHKEQNTVFDGTTNLREHNLAKIHAKNNNVKSVTGEDLVTDNFPTIDLPRYDEKNYSKKSKFEDKSNSKVSVEDTVQFNENQSKNVVGNQNSDTTKTKYLSDMELKVEKYIDETYGPNDQFGFDDTVKSGYEEFAYDDTVKSGYEEFRFDDTVQSGYEEFRFDDTVKMGYEEINKLRGGAKSINVDTGGTLLGRTIEQNSSERQEDQGGERHGWKNKKAKNTRKEYYATESRAALRQNTQNKSHTLHRRCASDGLLDRSLKGLFESTNWRPLSVSFDVDGYIAVIAIDFGTTYSGYAYCFTKHPDIIYMMRKPEGGDPGIYNQKTPTSILLTPDGTFHSFGYTARDFYHDLDLKEASRWMYFEHFKMMLHSNEEITSESKLLSENCKEASALKVFSYGLAYFKDHALRELSDQTGRRITTDQIKWVVTVPAIWNASAKQFMRQAAYTAGIVSADNPEQLLIALEPEAASMYCIHTHLIHPVKFSGMDDDYCDHSPSLSTQRLGDSFELAEKDSGTRYMIVDCGGGTTDITVHEIDSGGRLKEIHKAVGGPFGSLGVDREFELLLKAIFSKEIVDLFKMKRPAGWVDLMTTFESRKRGVGPYRTTCTTVSFPFAFIDFFKRRKGYGIETAVKKYGNKDITMTSSGMLRLSPAVMRRLFRTTINNIKREIGDVLNHPDTRGLSHLLLVGGFAESSLLQHEIRREFGHILTIIIPQGVGTITAKGAVLYGLNPDVIIQRRSRLTYGVGVLHRFKPEKHPANKKVVKDGIEWCSDILDRFVTVEQSVGLGETVTRSYTPVRKGQTSTIINIYSTERKEAVFITDKGVKLCGTLNLALTGPEVPSFSNKDGQQVTSDKREERREIRASMFFGDTEIKVSAVDLRTKRTVYASIDFLNI